MLNAEHELTKWAEVLDHKNLPAIRDPYRKAVTAKLLEQTEVETRNDSRYLAEATGQVTTGSVATYDPVLISLVRRAMPNLIAYDVAGVQPLQLPTGLIFAMKALRESTASAAITTADAEILFSESNTGFSAGDATGPTSSDPFDADLSLYSPTTGVSTATGEGDILGRAGFTIEKATVTAVTRQLASEYTMEIAHDLQRVHGLDAESELANILTTEILSEMNREVVRNINVKAILGAQQSGLTTAGTFDLSTDADGRWAVEKFKSLIFQIELEANVIAKLTRRGKGNIMICSSNVASAIAAAGMLDYTPALSTNLQVDDTGNTFAGVINGRMKVFIDPYATVDYVTVGYRGASQYDAGMFYCPYVPLQMVRAQDPITFQPKIAFKTRYGMVANPYATGTGAVITSGLGANRANVYYRIFKVDGINLAS